MRGEQCPDPIPGASTKYPGRRRQNRGRATSEKWANQRRRLTSAQTTVMRERICLQECYRESASRFNHVRTVHLRIWVLREPGTTLRRH